MWPFRRPKRTSGLSHDELIQGIQTQLGVINDYIERLEQAEKDIVNLNTAVERVLRKQSRWVELMNEKGDPERVAKFLEAQPRQGQPVPQVGEEIELGSEV